MKLFDSHAHLDFAQFDGFREDVIKEAFDNGLVGIINIGVDLESSQKSVALAEKHDKIWAAVGFHPHDAAKLDEESLRLMEELAKSPKVVAIGEIGLDFYRNSSPKDAQYAALERQIELALELNLPAVVHIRNAYDEAISLLRSKGKGKLSGVLHCFAGEEKHIDAARELGFLLSFNGTITYKNSRAAGLAQYAGLENIIIETDCPYLPPQEHRGQLNKPVYVHYVAEKLSEIFVPMNPEEIARITDANTRALFRLPPADAGIVAYVIKNNLYLNITNRCGNSCFFCARNYDYAVKGYDLKLNYEPSVEETLAAAGDVSKYDEVVFCGYGEPTFRMEVLAEISRKLKKEGARIRLNTNGQGSMINGRDITQELVGVVDSISISLNAPTKEQYNKICRPENKENAFDSVMEFAASCGKKLPEVILSVVDVPKLDIEECREIADRLGMRLRIRELNKAG
ncbi:MAG: radical SAM protein [candidate division Zixibacteria bacterium CG_4_9_14_3_um_filter_46_8]|nr:MAG: radical SAM protein [candidate division Zixibacteria bacterium CG_4_9_14_3_um_filter_46_8]